MQEVGVAKETTELCLTKYRHVFRAPLWGNSPKNRGYFSFQMAGQIDMNMQSDLMAAFEESL